MACVRHVRIVRRRIREDAHSAGWRDTGKSPVSSAVVLNSNSSRFERIQANSSKFKLWKKTPERCSGVLPGLPPGFFCEFCAFWRQINPRAIQRYLEWGVAPINSDALSDTPNRRSGLDRGFRRRDADGCNRDGRAPQKSLMIGGRRGAPPSRWMSQRWT